MTQYTLHDVRAVYLYTMYTEAELDIFCDRMGSNPEKNANMKSLWLHGQTLSDEVTFVIGRPRDVDYDSPSLVVDGEIGKPVSVGLKERTDSHV